MAVIKRIARPWPASKCARAPESCLDSRDHCTIVLRGLKKTREALAAGHLAVVLASGALVAGTSLEGTRYASLAISDAARGRSDDDRRDARCRRQHEPAISRDRPQRSRPGALS